MPSFNNVFLGVIDPWKFIGWVIIGVFGFIIFLFLLHTFLFLKREIGLYILHLKTRNIPPKTGQIWMQDDGELEIGKWHGESHFTIHTKNDFCKSSWGETPGEWKERVKNRKLFLISTKE